MADIKREYKPIPPDKPTIGLVMMVKNEEKRILVSLESVIGYVDAIIIYDTGSIDRTVEIIEEFCEKHKINLYLKRGEFVNFYISRNVCLDLADTTGVHYLLLLDCNDELRGGNILLENANFYFGKNHTGFLVCQQWWFGQLDKYYNVRFVKANSGWRYRGSVHEWMKDTSSSNDDPKYPVIRLTDSIVLYQDRTKDDNKSGKRFSRDKVLLLKDHEENPKDARTVFYLAQTCDCLNEYDDALYYSKLRIELGGFPEECFHSFMRCGNTAYKLKHDWSDVMKWYVQAYERFNRAEPLVKIADYYRHIASNSNNMWRLAYMYIREACELEYPDSLILFVDKSVYDYYRWHLMGIIAYYVGKYEEGKAACLRAIQQNVNKELDEKNLQFYLKDDKEKQKVTKEQYLSSKLHELRQKFPNIPQGQLTQRATAMWKKEQKKKK